MNQPTPAYVPGVCNINRKEIGYRRKVGYVGLAITVIVAVILLALSVSRYYRIVVFLPALIMASGFIQAKNKFCVGYGAAGTQNAEEGSNAAVAIADKNALAKDKAKTRSLNLQAFGIAILVTIAIVLLPEF